MENKAASSITGGKVAIVGAIITAVAGIITTIVTIGAPIVDKRLAIEATQTREAFVIQATSGAGAAVQNDGAATPQPVSTEQQTLPATATQVSAAANVSAAAGAAAAAAATPTQADTMLKVGEKWVVGNGLTVQLTDIEFPTGNEIHLHYTFFNTSDRVINVKLNHNRDVTVTDDKGNVYKWATDFTWEVSIAPGTDRKDEIKLRGNTNKASYFIIKLDLPEMGSATWKK